MDRMVSHGGYTRIQLDLFKCGGPLRSVHLCARAVRKIIEDHGMTIRKVLKDPFGENAHNAPYMLIFTLAESLIVIETWPEIGMVKVIVDLCHFSQNNAKRARLIAAEIVKIFGTSQYDERITEMKGVQISKAALDHALAAK